MGDLSNGAAYHILRRMDAQDLNFARLEQKVDVGTAISIQNQAVLEHHVKPSLEQGALKFSAFSVKLDAATAAIAHLRGGKSALAWAASVILSLLALAVAVWPP